MGKKILPPTHPGEILVEEFMKPLGLSQSGLAIALRIPNQRVHDLVHGRRGITLDTAARLARYFSTSTAFWMNLQTRYDLEVAEDEGLFERLDQDIRPLRDVEREERFRASLDKVNDQYGKALKGLAK